MSSDQVDFYAKIVAGLSIFIITGLVGWLFYTVDDLGDRCTALEQQISKPALEQQITTLEQHRIKQWEKLDYYERNLYEIGGDVKVLMDRSNRAN